MLDVDDLKDRLLNAERKLRADAPLRSLVEGARMIAKAEGVALARSCVEEMAKW